MLRSFVLLRAAMCAALCFALAAPIAAQDDLLYTLDSAGDIAGVSDANGDGHGDLLVRVGTRVRVFSGATGELLLAVEDTVSVDFRFRSVTGVPDADGDGLGDFAIGIYPPLGQGGEGKVYLHSGATGDLLHVLASPEPSSSFLAQFGAAISGVPDADGDGRGDVLVGAEEEGEAGRAYLYSGATGELIHVLPNPTGRLLDEFGDAVAGVPDADGDGRGDLLIGAHGAASGGVAGAGRAYLFSGATGAPLFVLLSPSPDLRGEFGQAVASVPDADGDGHGDLLVGAPRETPLDGVFKVGQAYLYSGATGALLLGLRSPNQEDRGRFGAAVAGVPDADGDGRGDLLVGAYQEEQDGAPPDAGRAYLFSGTDGSVIREYAPPDPVEEGWFGIDVAGVPDADGDGRGDVFVRGESPDVAYLFSGGGDTVSLTASATGSLSVAPGGSVSFSYTVANSTDAAVTGDLFYMAQDSAGATVASGVVTSGTLDPGDSASGTFTQAVPAGAPAGDYDYILAVGSFPSTTLDAETFVITVTAPAGTATGTAMWPSPEVAGGFSAPAAAGAAPAAGVAVYPNPSLGAATLTFSLDADAEVRLTVYDALGREVTVPAEGALEAGPHAVAFDGSGLPSGVYLWRLEGGGRVESGRLTLLR